MKTGKEIRLCPACPSTGSFVGVVNHKLRFSESTTIIASAPPDEGGYIFLEDNDGMPSVSLIPNQDFPDGVDKSSRMWRAQHELARRIGDCVSGTICRPELCPALSPDFIKHILFRPADPQ